MKIGTRTVLFGVHQFAIHPLIVAWCWWRRFGFRRVQIGHRDVRDRRQTDRGFYHVIARRGVYARLWDPRLWLAFVVHDLGYLGKPNLDGPEGETHPELGARIMRRLFGEAWGDFCLLHSRYYSRRLGRPVSVLAIVDKDVIVAEPSWLYLPRAWLTGELGEFMTFARTAATNPESKLNNDERALYLSGDPILWHRGLKSYMSRWIREHEDGREDHWTRVHHGGAGAPS